MTIGDGEVSGGISLRFYYFVKSHTKQEIVVVGLTNMHMLITMVVPYMLTTLECARREQELMRGAAIGARFLEWG